MNIYVSFLKPIKGYVSGEVRENIDLQRWADKSRPEDRYHILLSRRSRYASMDEIKQHVLRLRPDLTEPMQRAWSMNYTNPYHLPYQGIRVSVGSEVIEISPEDHESIVTTHIDPAVYADCAQTVSVETYNDLFRRFIINEEQYLTPALVRKIETALWKSYETGPNASDLLDALNNIAYEKDGEVIQFLRLAIAYAKKAKCAAVVSTE